MRVATQKVGTAGAPDQQHVARENRLWRTGRQYETERFAGMAGGMDGLYADPVHIQDPAVADPFGHAVRFRKFAHHRDTGRGVAQIAQRRSEEHTSELQSLMRNSYAVFCLKK